MQLKKKDKIVVAMSGGVDSSTVAAILNDEGYEVIGVTLQLYDVGEMALKKGACCAGQDIYDAKMAADKIGIPHYVVNYESLFSKKVIEDFENFTSYCRVSICKCISRSQASARTAVQTRAGYSHTLEKHVYVALGCWLHRAAHNSH